MTATQNVLKNTYLLEVFLNCDVHGNIFLLSIWKRLNLAYKFILTTFSKNIKFTLVGMFTILLG